MPSQMPSQKIENQEAPSLSPVRPKQPFAGSRLLRVAAALASSIMLLSLMLVVVELIFAQAQVGDDTVANPHPLLGYFQLANHSITFRSEGYSQSSFNSQGFRDRNYLVPKPRGVKRVVVLGDSVTIGLEVPLQCTFAKLLEQRLHENGYDNVEVLNCGMSGAGTGQEYLLFKDKIEALEPDLVVLAYHDGDADDNVCGGTTPPRPVFSVSQNGNLQVDFKDIDTWLASDQSRFYSSCEQLRRRSRLWSVITRANQDLVRDPVGKFINKIIDKPRGFVWNAFLKCLPQGQWHCDEARKVAEELLPQNDQQSKKNEAKVPQGLGATATAAVAGHGHASDVLRSGRASAVLCNAAAVNTCNAPNVLRSPNASGGANKAEPASIRTALNAQDVNGPGGLTVANSPSAPAAPNAVQGALDHSISKAVPVTAVNPVDRGQQDVDVFKGYLFMSRQRAAISCAIIKRLNDDCRKLRCRLIVAALPTFNNCTNYYRELHDIEHLADVERFQFVEAWKAYPPRPPMTESPYFFDLHFNRAGHRLMSEALYHYVVSVCKDK